MFVARRRRAARDRAGLGPRAGCVQEDGSEPVSRRTRPRQRGGARCAAIDDATFAATRDAATAPATARATGTTNRNGIPVISNSRTVAVAGIAIDTDRNAVAPTRAYAPGSGPGHGTDHPAPTTVANSAPQAIAGVSRPPYAPARIAARTTTTLRTSRIVARSSDTNPSNAN